MKKNTSKKRASAETRIMWPSGPMFFSELEQRADLEDDEMDGALRAAAGTFAYESHRMIRHHNYPHLAIQGLRTSVRLLELLDDRKLGHLDGVLIERVRKHEAAIRQEEKASARRGKGARR